MNLFKRASRLLIHPAITILVCSLFFMFLSLLATYRVRPFNSDDVAWQTQLLSWRPFNGHQASQGSTAPFVDKLPFFIAADKLASPSRRVLFAESYVLEAVGFGAFYIAGLYFLRRQGSRLGYVNLLPFVWLSTFGYAFAQMFLNANWRGFDLGMTFLTFLLTAMLFNRKYRDKQLPKAVFFIAPLAAFIAGVLIYSDPHYLYFTIIPLVLFAAWLRYLKVIGTGQLGSLYGGILLALIFAKVVKALSMAAGIKIINTYPIQFIDFDHLFSNCALTVHGILLIFGVDFFGHTLLSSASISGLLNLALLAAIGVVTYKLFKSYLWSKSYKTTVDPAAHWRILFGGLMVEALVLFTFSSLAIDITTYRYFLVLLLAAILLLSLKLGATTKRTQYIIAILLIAASVANIFVTLHNPGNPVTTPLSSSTANKANSDNYAMIAVLKDAGVHKGYANYWEGNINTYLSGGVVKSLPTLCVNGITTRFYWLMDDSQFDVPAAKSFYLYDPDYAAPATCSVKQLVRQFGVPQKTVKYANKTLLIYNYDIGDKIH